MIRLIVTLIAFGIVYCGYSQKRFELGFQTGLNMGFVSMNGDYTLENDYKSKPALHFGITTSLNYPDFIFESGLLLEGTVFEQEVLLYDINGSANGLLSNNDVGAYLAVPFVIYPKTLPLGLHGGLKPKFEAGSASIFEDSLYPNQSTKYHPIHYLANFGMDLLVGVSIPVSFMRFSLRYERGLINRLANSPDMKEYDNQVKFVLNLRVFHNDLE